MTTRRKNMNPEAFEMDRNFRKANVIAYHVQKMHTLSHESRFTRMRELFEMGQDTLAMIERGNKARGLKGSLESVQPVKRPLTNVDRLFYGKEDYFRRFGGNAPGNDGIGNAMNVSGRRFFIHFSSNPDVFFPFSNNFLPSKQYISLKKINKKRNEKNREFQGREA